MCNIPVFFDLEQTCSISNLFLLLKKVYSSTVKIKVLSKEDEVATFRYELSLFISVALFPNVEFTNYSSIK